MSAVPASARVARPNGWWGMAVFIATEATLFGTMIASYFYLDFRAVHWPPPGIPKPEVVVPVILTAVLVATTVPIRLASRAATAGDARATRGWLALILFVQAGYFAMQIHEFIGDAAKVEPERTAYGSIYVTLTGAHHLHVGIGLLLVAFLVLRLTRGLTPYRQVGVRSVCFYLYFVNVLALLVLGTQLSARA